MITTFSPDVNAPFEVYLSASIYVKPFEDICPAEAISLNLLLSKSELLCAISLVVLSFVIFFAINTNSSVADIFAPLFDKFLKAIKLVLSPVISPK